MARSKSDGKAYRERWWEERLEAAHTPGAKVTVLQSKIKADISQLPEDRRAEASSRVAVLLEEIVDELATQKIEAGWTA